MSANISAAATVWSGLVCSLCCGSSVQFSHSHKNQVQTKGRKRRERSLLHKFKRTREKRERERERESQSADQRMLPLLPSPPPLSARKSSSGSRADSAPTIGDDGRRGRWGKERTRRAENSVEPKIKSAAAAAAADAVAVIDDRRSAVSSTSLRSLVFGSSHLSLVHSSLPLICSSNQRCPSSKSSF